jgi:hypothetical protein
MNAATRALFLLVLALVLGACTGGLPSGDTSGPDETQSGQTIVAPDFEAYAVVINVALTDDGFEPSTIFIPAGRHIRIILRNHGSREHHFRIGGLIPTQMSWRLEPDVSEDELESMDEDQLAELGIDGDVDDMDHVLHHLSPSFVPFRAESPKGIKPLPNEVHGYVTLGKLDVMEFFATNTGTFVSEDVLYPEITGRVIVFEEGA